MQIGYHEFRLFRDLFHEQCGIYLDDNKKYLVETRLAQLVRESECAGFGEFFNKLKTASIHGSLFKKLFDVMTTNETLWFRDQKPFQVLEKYILPGYIQDIKDEKRKEINIWSAACSSGQEPYSLAITAIEFFNTVGLGEFCRTCVKILATDISTTMLSDAKKGQYDRIAISRGLPEKYMDLYFEQNQDKWDIKENVKKLIAFRQLNLKDPFGHLDAAFDIIFLRNVIIYFSDSFKKELFRRIDRHMVPGGYFFLGTGETIGSYSDAYEICRFEGSVFYRKKR